MSIRSICARGIIPNDRGKPVRLPDGTTALLRGFEHSGDVTVLTVVTSVELKHSDIVEVHDG